jgi:hypothetical protein
LCVENDSVCSRAASCVWVVVEASQDGKFLVWARDGEAETLCIKLGTVYVVNGLGVLTIVVVGVRIRIHWIVILVALTSSGNGLVDGRSVVADGPATSRSAVLADF